MIPANITDKLITLSATQKAQVVDMCINHLTEISGQAPQTPVPRRIRRIGIIKKELDQLIKAPLRSPSVPVANYVATGEQLTNTITDVHQFAFRLRAILKSNIYEKLSNANMAGANNDEFKKMDIYINQLITYTAELTAAIDLKFAHQANKNFSLRKHNRTFVQQATDFIKRVMKDEAMNAAPSCVIPTSLKPQNLAQGNNNKSVAALVASFSEMFNKQAVHNLRSFNRGPAYATKVNDLPKVKLTIR